MGERMLMCEAALVSGGTGGLRDSDGPPPSMIFPWTRAEASQLALPFFTPWFVLHTDPSDFKWKLALVALLFRILLCLPITWG